MASPQPTREATGEASNGRVARLMITKIVLENFKSYAGIQEVGPFHKVRNIYIYLKQYKYDICFSVIFNPHDFF
jgi:hypothetical protein